MLECMSDEELRPIVVGVDDTPASAAALRWAVAEARRRSCSVDAISVWHMDYGVVLTSQAMAAGFDIEPARVESARRAVLEAATEGVTEVELRRILVEGDPRKLLVEMSRDAQLLVVGNRGHSAITELVLGSVSSYCVHHATCPVVVVKAAEEMQHLEEQSILPLTPGPLL